MKNVIKFLLFSVLVMSCVLLISNFAYASESIYVPDEIIVKLNENIATTAESAGKIANGFGASVDRVDTSAEFMVLKLPTTATVDQALAYYNNKSLRPEVEYAEPNYIRQMSWTPNDPVYPLQWHYTAINLSQAWDYDTIPPLHGGDPSVIAAVLDSGVAYENWDVYSKATDFTGSYPSFAAGYDFVNNDAHPNDDNGHGTHVSSTIAQSTDNGFGAAGIAFNSSIMPVKVCHATDGCTDDAIGSGLNYAKDHGARIVSMSLGGGPYSKTLEDIVTSIINSGVIVVAATGNGGGDGIGDAEINYPAKYNGVIAVGATRYHNNQRASYSNYGQGISLVAPGGEVSEGYYNDYYGWFTGGPDSYANCINSEWAFLGFPVELDTRVCSGDGVIQQSFYSFFQPTYHSGDISQFTNWPIQGTSMATPHVSGAAALLLAYGVPTNNVKSILQNSATDMGVGGYDYEYGYGLLNAANGFTFPTITSLSTASADNSENTNITVTGTNFAAGATMTVGSTALTNVNVVNNTTITATVPKHIAAGTYDVLVTSNGKTTSASNSFTVLDSVPSDISNLRVLTKNGSVYFKWKNPTTWDFKKVKILRKNKSFPTSYADGKKVFNKKKTSFINKNLNKNKKYYYKIYTYDTAGNYSSGIPIVIAPKVNSVISENSNNYSAVGDVNADGLDEIIVGAKKGHDPKIYITDRSGKKLFKKNGFYPFGSGKSNCGINVAAGDLNNDGKDEIIVSQGSPCKPTVKVFNQKGKSKFKKKGFKPFKKSIGATVASGDLDGDNFDEIIVGQEKGAAKVYIYKLSGNSFAKVFKNKGFKAFSGKNGVRVFSGDLDFNGQDEIIAAPNSGKQEIRIFKKNGKKKFKSLGFLPYGNYSNYLRVFVGDANSDGYAEILTAFLANAKIDSWSYKGQKSTPEVVGHYVVGSKEFVVGRF